MKTHTANRLAPTNQIVEYGSQHSADAQNRHCDSRHARVIAGSVGAWVRYSAEARPAVWF